MNVSRKWFALIAVIAFALVSVAAAQLDGSQPKPAPGTRTLLGFVTDKQDKPVPQALVYLKNTKTQMTKTYIAGSDGSYHFHSLSLNIDYEVHAEKDGKRSDTKTLSTFDTRPQIRINLKLDK